MTEVRRVIADACQPFYQPLSRGCEKEDRDNSPNPFGFLHANKRESLKALLEDGQNVVCSHKLFSEVGELANQGMLIGYDVMVDEVLSVAEVATSITQVRCRSDEFGESNNDWRSVQGNRLNHLVTSWRFSESKA